MTADTIIAALQGYPAGATYRQLRAHLRADAEDLDIGIASALRAGGMILNGGLYILRPDSPREMPPRYVDRRIAALMADEPKLLQEKPSRPVLRLKRRKEAA